MSNKIQCTPMYKQYNIKTGNQMNNRKIKKKNIKYELVNSLRKIKRNEKCLESHLGKTESLGDEIRR